MSRANALIVGILALLTVALVSMVLIVEFDGKDAAILIAAIVGFVTPTVIGFMTLLQAVINREQTAEVGAQVASVNSKVNGHLARLTQVVVNSASSNEAIDGATIQALADRTAALTGRPISIPTAATTAETLTPPETAHP